MKSTPTNSKHEWLISYILAAHEYLGVKQFSQYFDIPYTQVLRMADLSYNRELAKNPNAKKIKFKKRNQRGNAEYVKPNMNKTVHHLDNSVLFLPWVSESMGGRNALRRYL